MNENFIQEICIQVNKVDRDSYLEKIPFVKSGDKLRLCKRVTILTGENGSGKSTLLEGIAAAYGLNPDGGTRNFQSDSALPSGELARAISLKRGIKRPQDEFFFELRIFVISLRRLTIMSRSRPDI